MDQDATSSKDLTVVYVLCLNTVDRLLFGQDTFFCENCDEPHGQIVINNLAKWRGEWFWNEEQG